MKKFLLPLMLFVLCLVASCPNPMLKWIETPEVPAVTPPVPPAPPAPPTPQVISSSDKAITTFSFGIPGEEISIRAEPGQDGSIPIKAILPSGASRAGLSPSITYIGESITPPGGALRDFTNPQVYTVKAKDGSEQPYTVQVYVKDAAPAAIVWFDLELPGSGGIMSEGVVTEGSAGQPGHIIVHVPSGTSLTSLTAKIAHTGTLSDGPGVSAGGNSETAVTLTGDFSPTRPEAERTYTVQADSTTKQYVVTVVKDKSSEKEITAFSFAGFENNETVIIGAVPQPDGKYPIIVTVPVTTALNLTPSVIYEGAALKGAGISSTRTTNFADPFPVTAGGTEDFSVPVTYTVTAEDDSTRDYEVTVYKSSLNTGKQITGFYFNLVGSPAMGAVGIINETAKTIVVTVPAGTNPVSLAPTIYHTGVSVSPLSGEPKNFSDSIKNPVPYTVTARDGSTQTYMASVFVAARSDKGIGGFDFTNVSGDTAVIGTTPGPDGKIPIVVTVPFSPGTDITKLDPQITHGGTSITGPGIPAGGPGTVTGSSTDFTGPVTYTVTAEDGSSQDYSVTVVKTADPTLTVISDLASIDGFYFNNPMAIGTINQNAGTIAVTVPYDTDVTKLTPTIYFTGNIVVPGAAPDTTTTPIPGPPVKPAMSSPAGFAAADFSSPVQYTVTALNQSTSKTYKVTVTSSSPPPTQPSTVRAISAFSFDTIPLSQTTTVISSTPDASGKYHIEITVPPPSSGTIEAYLGSLAPKVTYTGVSINGPSGFSDTNTTDPPEIPKTATGSSTSFVSPQSYTVKAEDLAQTSEYVVTVRAEDNNAKEITAFYFTNPVAIGEINQTAHTITVRVPYGTDISKLVPTIFYDGLSLDPVSGTERDFRSPAVYTVKARNGTVQPYTVTVQPAKNSAKEISAVSFPDVGVLDTAIGAIPGPDGKFPISVTVSQNTNISSLIPKITHTGASITPPGGTAQKSPNPYTDAPRSFSSPQSYRITAEDGSTKDYTVSVHSAGGGSAVITGFVFKVEDNSVLVAQAVGAIDQTNYAITVALPSSVNSGIMPDDLIPTITYIGASITPQVRTQPEQPRMENPLTDRDRDFSDPSNPVSYIVTAKDGVTTQEYTVTIIFEQQNTGVSVSFQGITDPNLVTTSFNQGTGILSLALNSGQLSPAGDYTSPYEWRLDGRKLIVSATEPFLELHTAGLVPGQHEVVVTVTKKDVPAGYPTHYTNKVYFSIHE